MDFEKNIKELLIQNMQKSNLPKLNIIMWISVIIQKRLKIFRSLSLGMKKINFYYFIERFKKERVNLKKKE